MTWGRNTRSWRTSSRGSSSTKGRCENLRSRRPRAASLRLSDVLLDVHREFRAVQIALRVGGDAFGRGRTRRRRVRIWIRDEEPYAAVPRAPDPDPPPAARIESVAVGSVSGFRIGNIKDVVLVDEDSAWSAKLLPLGDKATILVEDLKAIVLAVADEQPAP